MTHKTLLLNFARAALFSLPFLLPATAMGQDKCGPDFMFDDGQKIVLQDKVTGGWIRPANPFGSLGGGGLLLPLPKPGIVPESVFEVNCIPQFGPRALELLGPSGEQWWTLFQLPSFYPFPEDLFDDYWVFTYQKKIQRSHYAFDVLAQLESIAAPGAGSTFDEWRVNPCCGKATPFEPGYHTQGMTILADGTWVQVQSPNYIQRIDPFTESNLGGALSWGDSDIHPEGIQASGNVVAVQSPNKNGTSPPSEGPDVRFFRAVEDEDSLWLGAGVKPLSHLRLEVDEWQDKAVGGVGFTYVANVGYFLYPQVRGNSSLWFRPHLREPSWLDDPPLPESHNGWKKIKNSDIIRGGESGVHLIMEAGTGAMYLFSFGLQGDDYQDPEGRLGPIRVKRINPGEKPEDFWRSVSSKGNLPSELPNGKSVVKNLGEFEFPLGQDSTWVTWKETGVLPLNPLGIPRFEHSYRWGGAVNVNAAGALELAQAPRDFFADFNSLRQEDYVLVRYKDPKPYNPYSPYDPSGAPGVTRGRIKRIKCLEVTGLGGEDEIALVSSSQVGDVRYEVTADTPSWNPGFTINTSSVEGTYVYLVEKDFPGDLKPGDDLIGKIFIPPSHYAHPGTRTFTTILAGDGGRYEVTYEIQGPNVPPTVSADHATVQVDEADKATNSGTWSDLNDNVTLSSVTATVGTVTLASGGDGEGTWSWEWTTSDGPDDSQPVTITVTDDDGASGQVTFHLIVNNVAPSIDPIGLSSSSIDEGQSVTVSGTFSDPALGVPTETFTGAALWSDGQSTAVSVDSTAGTFVTSRSFSDDHPVTGTPLDNFTVDITITDDDTGTDTESSPLLTVHNVDPTITATSNSAAECGDTPQGMPVDVTVDFFDPGFGPTEDWTASTIDWGDGFSEPATVSVTPGSFGSSTTGRASGTHVYATGGIFTITVTVADDDAGSAATEMTALVTGAGLTPQGLLGVVGTDYLDVVGIQKKFKRDIVVNAGFLGPGKADFVESDVASIEVRVCDGNDQIHVGGDIAKPAILDGGPGPDHIRAGSGVSMVLGGWGNDTLFAGRFGSVLFGGPGDDDLNGNKGDDMLFGEEGDDKLAGDKGNDELDGGPGLDDCNPGKGSDVVVNCESSGLAPGGPHSGTRPSGRPAAGSAAPPRSRGPNR